MRRAYVSFQIGLLGGGIGTDGTFVRLLAGVCAQMAPVNVTPLEAPATGGALIATVRWLVLRGTWPEAPSRILAGIPSLKRRNTQLS